MSFEKVEAHCREAVEKLYFPSAVIAIGDGQGVYYKKAFGYERVLLTDDKPDGIFKGTIPDGAPRATTDTLYDMASLSKLISTTMVALRMLEDGDIALYDTVGMYFDAPEDKRGITIKQLMTHTSGISAHFALSTLCADKSGILQAVLDYPLAYQAETKVVYSCMGYILLAKILEKIGGAGLDTLAEKYVFSPLHMEHTCYNPLQSTKAQGRGIATTEWSPTLGRYVYGVVHDENARFGGGVSGNAGVFSCVDDMIKFASMLSNRGQTSDGYYLTPMTFERAITNYTPYADEYRGLGFSLSDKGINACGDLYGLLSYGHNGFTGTSLYVERESGMYVILLTNRVHYTRASSDIFRFRRIIHNTAAAEYSREKGRLGKIL